MLRGRLIYVGYVKFRHFLSNRPWPRVSQMFPLRKKNFPWRTVPRKIYACGRCHQWFLRVKNYPTLKFMLQAAAAGVPNASFTVQPHSPLKNYCRYCVCAPEARSVCDSYVSCLLHACMLSSTSWEISVMKTLSTAIGYLKKKCSNCFY